MDNQNYILPEYNIVKKKVEDGVMVNIPALCKRNLPQCQQHYENIENKEGTFECPFGFTSHVEISRSKKVILTGFRLDGCFNKNKTKPLISSDVSSPVINRKQLKGITKVQFQTKLLIEENTHLRNFNNELVHEIKNFNAQISTKAESLTLININDRFERKIKQIIGLSHNIFALSTLINERFLVYDILSNPELIRLGSKSKIGVYKKFDRIHKCYQDEALKNEIKIQLSGNSYGLVNAYDSIELLPFLLIDNAIKYSPALEYVNINFNEYRDTLNVTVESKGPFISREELGRVFDRGFRSETAKSTNITGNGIGLNLAKVICDLNQVEIKVSFEDINEIHDNIHYGLFKVHLKFNITQF